MKHFCNPLNLDYKYQFIKSSIKDGNYHLAKEAADPSGCFFKGVYYIFASMSLGVYYSSDLITWKHQRLDHILPCYDYAPDIRVHGEYVYFCASKMDENCPHFRTKDILNGPYEKIEGSHIFWDPNIFFDDDGKVYLYHGSSNVFPIYGVELDPKSFKPLHENIPLVYGDHHTNGYERFGEDHQKTHIFDGPFIEGAWMNKHNGTYYLQYGTPGTEINVYGDGVKVSNKPLGPFVSAKNNPYSYAPGSFMRGAGHGSTFKDNDKYYHLSTMEIAINYNCERRLGLWKAGFDKDGELYCDQRYNDWPINLNTLPFSDPDYYLLSYKKKVTCSSLQKDYYPSNITDENCQTFYKGKTSNEWVLIDLEKVMDVRFIQINYGDVENIQPLPKDVKLTFDRYIEEQVMPYSWTLEYSKDGLNYYILKEHLDINTSLSHNFVELEQGVKARYIRLTTKKTPFNEAVTISGLRIFGKEDTNLPNKATTKVKRISDLDMIVEMSSLNATGYNVLWGLKEDKLYHSYLTYKNKLNIGALVKNETYFVRVDTFNGAGITHGDVLFVGEKHEEK